MGTPSDKIAAGDQWYTSEQVTDACCPHMRRTIENRFRFFVASILEWQFANQSRESFSILDAGCGDGVILKELAKMKGAKCFGVDNNPLRFSRARKNVPEAIIVEGDLRIMDLTENAFDVIILNQVLEHIDRDDYVLRSLVRALIPEGLLILGVPNEGCLMARLRNHVLSPSIAKTTDHVNFYTESSIRSKLERSGLCVVDVVRENFFFPRQEIGMILVRYDWGYQVAQLLGRMMKSQVAGLLFACRKLHVK